MRSVQSAPVNRIKASFPVRRLSFDFKTSSRYWFDNNPYFTHFMNAMSGIFPQGELMLIETLRKIRIRVTDQNLQAEMSAFIGQEAMHAKEHMTFNRYAVEQQIDINHLEQEMKRIYALMQKILPTMHIMAIGCAIEHTTATLGAALLSRDDWNQRLTGPVGNLWLWHALEENEHKAVFFDAYIATGGSYITRIFYMAIAGGAIGLLIANNMRRLLKADQQLASKEIIQFLWAFAGPDGLVTTKVIKEFLDYYRPSFHPTDHNTKILEQQWREKLQLADV